VRQHAAGSLTSNLKEVLSDLVNIRRKGPWLCTLSCPDLWW